MMERWLNEAPGIVEHLYSLGDSSNTENAQPELKKTSKCRVRK